MIYDTLLTKHMWYIEVSVGREHTHSILPTIRNKFVRHLYSHWSVENIY